MQIRKKAQASQQLEGKISHYSVATLQAAPKGTAYTGPWSCHGSQPFQTYKCLVVRCKINISSILKSLDVRRHLLELGVSYK